MAQVYELASSISMARLSELVTAVAEVLKVKEGTLIKLAQYLREAGLIAQKGRGTGAAHMSPRDATNLVLGVMTTGSRTNELRDAPRNVALMREAKFDGAEINFDGHVHLDAPPFPFLTNEHGTARDLGDALDALIDEIVRYGDPVTDAGLPIEYWFLEVEQPEVRARFDLKGHDQCLVHFHRQDPQLDSRMGELRIAKAKRIARAARLGMKTTTRIGLDELSEIAAVLRGYEPQKGERVIPPYEQDR
jgi:hypothetical protein